MSRLLNPAWCERSWCCRGSVQSLVHTSVIRKLVMPRDSVRRFLNPVWCKRSLCWRGSGQRGSAERSCSYRFNVGCSCLNLAFYQCSRPTRACSGRRFASSEIVTFSAPVSATMLLPSIGGGAAKAQPVGRVSVRERASISNDAFWCSS